MRLDDLIKGIEVKELIGSSNPNVNDFHFDSRKIKNNDLFIAIAGTFLDGNKYIDDAIKNGASVIVCNKLPDNLHNNLTYVLLSFDSREALAIISKNFYDNPSSKLKLIGVTGTNGKTSVVSLLHQLFSQFGYKCGLISTVENLVYNQKIKSSHTTPDPKQINFLLNEMIKNECEYCFMEVSSHSVDQKRIHFLEFDVAVFTNISHDHLDYHKNFKNYLNTKKLFFDNLNEEATALVNKDDKRSSFILQNTKANQKNFSLKSFSDFKCKIIESDLNGMLLSIDNNEVWVKLTGMFNAYNLLAVYSVAVLLEEDSHDILQAMSLISPAEGRFETFKNNKNNVCVLDYAHTEDALRNVISTINSIKKNNQNLITVFGCGGGRDKLKRPLMTRVAYDLSSKIILTSDNPRNEPIDEIISDMLKGIENDDLSKVLIINDREQAIKTAFAIAQTSDIILIAGKGHEKFQEINGEKMPFDDKEKILELINQNIK